MRREALEALAIHFEHRARDLSEAHRFARLSLAERVGTRGMAGEPVTGWRGWIGNDGETARTCSQPGRLWQDADGY